MISHTRGLIALSTLIAIAFTLGGCTKDEDAPSPPPTLSITQDAGWSTITRTPVVNDVIYTGSKYIAVGNAGYIAESTDGVAWTEIESGTSHSLDNIVVLGTKMVANMNTILQGEVSETLGMLISNGGTTWTAHTFNSSGDCSNPNTIFHDNIQFVGLFNTNQLCTSSNGASWAKVNELNGFNLSSASYGGGTYILRDDEGTLIRANSLTSASWDEPTLPAGMSNGVSDLLYANSRFVAIAGSLIYYSINGGVNWGLADTPVTGNSYGHLNYSSDRGFIAYKSTEEYRTFGDGILTSTDGVTWDFAYAIAQPINALANGTNETIAFGYSGHGFRSTDLDLTTWAAPKMNQPAGTIIAHAKNGQNTFVASYELYTVNNEPVTSNTTWKSTDNGASWTNIYTSYDIQDLIHDGTQLILADSDTIVTSTNGRDWITALTRGLPTASVKIDNATYYVGESGSVLSSTDGINFTSPPNSTHTSQNLIRVASNGNGLVAISAQGAVIRFDGNSWSTHTLSSHTGINAIVWNGSVYVIVGNTGNVFTSDDGATWTSQSYIHTGNITDILSVGTLLIAASQNGITTSSDNGVTWVNRTPSDTPPAKYLAYNGTNYFGFTDSTNTPNTPRTTNYTSEDGLTWTPKNFVASNPVTTSGFTTYDSTNTRFVRYLTDTIAGTTYGQILASADGQMWNWSSTLPTDSSFSYISAIKAISTNANASNAFFSSGATAGSLSFGVAYSDDGANWSLKTDQIYNPSYTPTSGIYARLTESGAIETSTDDRVTWTTTIPVGMDEVVTITGLEYVNDQYLASVKLEYNGFYHFSAIYKSDDATNWTLQAELPYDSLHPTSIRYDGTNYLFFAQNEVTNVMIYQSTDLVDFTLYDTGIKGKFIDVKIESTGYKLFGENATLATRAVY